MPRYLIAIHRPNDYDHAVMIDDAVRRAIDAVNDEMVAAGVRVFVGGLRSIDTARSIRLEHVGVAAVTEGAYLKSDEYVDGFWVLELPDIDAATDWGKKAAAACRGGVEVRAFY